METDRITKRRKHHKWRTAKITRMLFRKAANKVTRELQEGPAWMRDDPMGPEVWHAIWFADSKHVWSTLAASLQILQCMIRFWDMDEKTEHSSPYYAYKWICQARATKKHIQKLKLQPSENVATVDRQKRHREIDKQSTLLDVDEFLHKLLHDKIWSGTWSFPIESNTVWPHTADFQTVLRSRFEQRLRLKDLNRYAWSKFCKLAGQCPQPRGSVKTYLQNEIGQKDANASLTESEAERSSIPREPRKKIPSVANNDTSALHKIRRTIPNYMKKRVRLVAEHATVLTTLKRNEFYDFYPQSHSSDLCNILRLLNENILQKRTDYIELLLHDDCSDSMLAWTAVAYQSLATLSWRRILPSWFTRPKDGSIRTYAGSTPDDYWDPGNLNLETLWFALRIWTFVDPSFEDLLCSASLKPYGTTSQHSGKGITNFRGNMLEGILGHAKEMANQ